MGMVQCCFSILGRPEPTVGLSYSHINQRLTEIQSLMAAATRDWETALLQLEEVEKENPLEAEGEAGEGS
jgi:hypothetical protein